VSVTGVSGTAYAYYRTGTGAYTKFTDTSIAADGDIAVTGLTNGTAYGFQVINESGSYLSVPSNEMFSSPTDGSNAASGIMALPKSYLRTLLAASSTFQAWVGVADAESALAYIHITALDATDGEFDRPFGLVSDADPATFARRAEGGGAGNTYIDEGVLHLYLEAAVAASGHEAQDYEFTNTVSGIIADMSAIAGTGSYLNAVDFEIVSGPARSGEDEDSDYYQVVVSVTW